MIFLACVIGNKNSFPVDMLTVLLGSEKNSETNIEMHISSNSRFGYKIFNGDTTKLETQDTSKLLLDGYLTNGGELKEVLGINNKECLSDGKLLAIGYLKEGLNFFKRAKGSYAGILFDENSGITVAFKDSFGLRSLYMARYRDTYIIASRIVQFCTLEGMSINTDYVNKHFINQSFIGLGTPLYGVKSVPAGNAVIFEGSKVQYKYIGLPSPQPVYYKKKKEYVEEFGSILRQAVQRQITPGKKILTTISGGLDCTLISANLLKLLGDIEGATFCFNDYLKADESMYVKDFADMYNASIHEVDIESGDYYTKMKDLIFDEPNYYALTMAWRDIGNHAKKLGCETVFAGFGGDEIVPGFDYLADLANGGQYIQLIKHIVHLKTKGYPLKFLIGKSGLKLKWLSENPNNYLNITEEAGTYSKIPIFNMQYNPKFHYSGSPVPILNGSQSMKRLYNRFVQGDIGRLVYRYEQDCIQPFGADLRSPFLDVDVVNYSLSIPSNIHVRSGLFKNLHRSLGEEILPKSIIRREVKNNFVNWLTYDLQKNRGKIESFFNDSVLEAEGLISGDDLIFGKKALTGELRLPYEEIKFVCTRLMSYIAMELWWRNVYEQKGNSILWNT